MSAPDMQQTIGLILEDYYRLIGNCERVHTDIRANAPSSAVDPIALQLFDSTIADHLYILRETHAICLALQHLVRVYL
jgi:hypothetical protein